MTPRTLAILGAIMLVLGIVLAALGDSTVDAFAVATGGLGAVALTSSVFWAIGRSEDRERERERDRPPT